MDVLIHNTAAMIHFGHGDEATGRFERIASLTFEQVEHCARLARLDPNATFSIVATAEHAEIPLSVDDIFALALYVQGEVN